MFLAQGDSKAPVTSSNIVNKVDEYVTKASNYENIMFWTLQQLSVVNSLQMLFVFLDAFYGTGNTPPRTPRISGLKSQILKPTFLS